MQSHSFMYLGELLHYYQSSNNLRQSAQTFDFNLKSCIVLLNTSSCSASWLVSVSLLLLWFSTRSACCRLVSVSIFHALCCSTPRVTLLILDLSPFQSLLLWFAQHIESLCSLLTGLDCLNLSCFVLNTSTRSARCSVVSGGYLNTHTFIRPVIVNFYPLCRSNFLLLMCHSSKLLSISTFFSSPWIRFLFSCFLCFCYWVFTSTQPLHAVAKKVCTDIYIYI